MAKDKLTDYDATAANNLDVGGISVAEGMLPSGVNNAIRELMSHQADAFGAGTPLYVDQTNNRLGIGNAAPATALDVDANGATVATFDRATSDGTIVDFRKDGSTVGTISAYAGSIIAGSGDTGIFFYDAGDVLRPVSPTTLSTRDNTIDIGSSAARFKDLYLSGGVVFGATGGVVTSKTLDDYEEGTWTPSFQASVTNPTVTAQGNSLGRYVKIGNIVHFWFYDNSTNITNAGSGFASVGGLPYTNEAGYYPVFQYVHGNHFTTASAGGYVSASTNSCIFIERDTINVVNWATGTRYMMISGTYRTA